MSFIDLGTDLNDVKFPSVVPEGMYDLTIDKATATEKDGKKGIQVILSVDGNLDAANIFHNLSLPGAADDDEKKLVKLRFLKKFLELFKIHAPNGQLDLTQFPGSCAKVKVVLDEYNGMINNKLKV